MPPRNWFRLAEVKIIRTCNDLQAALRRSEEQVPKRLELGLGLRQLVRLLNTRKDEFLTEAPDVLRAGLSSAIGSRWTTLAHATVRSSRTQEELAKKEDKKHHG
jgi:hypothetical protein